jgi:hypothetical protein
VPSVNFTVRRSFTVQIVLSAFDLTGCARWGTTLPLLSIRTSAS